MLHDLDEVWVQRSASLYVVVGMVVVKKTKLNLHSLDPKRQTYTCLLYDCLSLEPYYVHAQRE